MNKEKLVEKYMDELYNDWAEMFLEGKFIGVLDRERFRPIAECKAELDLLMESCF